MKMHAETKMRFVREGAEYRITDKMRSEYIRSRLKIDSEIIQSQSKLEITYGHDETGEIMTNQ
jgi:hypothetical protein